MSFWIGTGHAPEIVYQFLAYLKSYNLSISEFSYQKREKGGLEVGNDSDTALITTKYDNIAKYFLFFY